MDSIQLLKRLVSIPSVNPILLRNDLEIKAHMKNWAKKRHGNLPDNENELVDYIGGYIKDSGSNVDVYIFNIADVFRKNPDEVIEITNGGRKLEDLEGRNCLIAVKRGPAGKNILFNAHLDTWPSMGWEINPFEAIEKDGYLVGHGVADTKGNLAAMMYTLVHSKTDKNLILIANPDEEGGSPIGLVAAAKYLMSAQFPISFRDEENYFILGEPTSCQVQNKHPTSVQFEIQARGIPNSHMVFLDERDSASGLCRLLYTKFLDGLRDSSNLDVAVVDIPNITTKGSPYNYDTHPSELTAFGAIRTYNSIKEIEEAIREAISKLEGNFNFDISAIMASSIMGFHTEPDNRLVRIAEAARKQYFGKGSEITDFWKAVCDAGGFQTYTKENGVYIPTIIIGAGELFIGKTQNIHKPNERLSIKEFGTYQKILENIIEEL